MRSYIAPKENHLGIPSYVKAPSFGLVNDGLTVRMSPRENAPLQLTGRLSEIILPFGSEWLGGRSPGRRASSSRAQLTARRRYYFRLAGLLRVIFRLPVDPSWLDVRIGLWSSPKLAASGSESLWFRIRGGPPQ